MSVLPRNLFAFLGILRQRVRNHLGLLAAVWAGLTLAVALVVSIPVYAETAGYRILLAELAAEDSPDPLPPFSLIYSYGGAGADTIGWEQFRQADRLAANLSALGISVPVQRSVRYAATEQLAVLFPDDNTEVARARLAFLSGFEQNVQLVEGDLPRPAGGDAPVDVLVSETMSNKQTMLVDDIYRVEAPAGSANPDGLLVRVAGIWRPIDENSDYWFNPPSALSVVLMLPEASFASVVDDPGAPWLRYASWYTALDIGGVRGADVPALTARIRQATATLDQVLPGTELSRSPVEALSRHREQVQILTVTLALFSVPLLGLLGYFIVQIAGMVVQRQQQEIAILRGRGSSRLQVLGLALGQALALAAGALLLGIPLGLLAAQLMVWTHSFLRWSPAAGPPVQLLPASWRHALIVVALALPAVVAPALSASHATIISLKQDRARSGAAPLWQRMFVDILLLVAGLYGYQQLRTRGMIGVPGMSAAADDPFRNPVLMLAPALLVFALALLALRLIPRLLSLLAWLFRRSRGVTVLSLRSLARTIHSYAPPVLLIILTLSLSAFTSSMARTLDQHSEARSRYSAGADIRLAYMPTAIDETSGGQPAAIGGDPSTPGSIDYLFVPVDEYLEAPGVQAVTRVATSEVFLAPADGIDQQGTFMGIDRISLPGVVNEAWRPDYGPESLGMLMNRLAGDPSSILVSVTYAAEQGLRVGDRLVVSLNDVGETQEASFVVAGTVDYFPTLYAENGPFVIGNLDYSFEQQGSPYPYEIWIDVAPGTDIDPIRSRAYGYGLRIRDNTPQSLLQAELLRPERQGLFGLLSVGFVVASLVTMIGYLAHTLVSFQRRLVELGMLRAIGLRTAQLAWLLILEQALVIGLGTGIGTAVGVLATRLFVPFLQVRAGAFPDTPPFQVQIAWDQIVLVYAVAGIMLALAVGVTLFLLSRMRLFAAVKLGDAV